MLRDDGAWERFTRWWPPRGRVGRERGRVVYASATWGTSTCPAYCDEQSCDLLLLACGSRERRSAPAKRRRRGGSPNLLSFNVGYRGLWLWPGRPGKPACFFSALTVSQTLPFHRKPLTTRAALRLTSHSYPSLVLPPALIAFHFTCVQQCAVPRPFVCDFFRFKGW